MAQYTLNWTNDTLKPSFTIQDISVNTVSTDLKLYGRGARGYGEGMQENMLHLLENFAGDVPPLNPTMGQIWFNSSDGSFTKGLKVFDGSIWVSALDFDLAGSLDQISSKVDKAGDTMTGALILNGSPVDSLQATTKQYVDDGDLLSVQKTGDVMSGFLTLHADPTLNLHAATKAYVDFAIFESFKSFLGIYNNELGDFKRREITAVAGQTVFSIPEYVVGNNSLWGVYVNGVKQVPSSYSETSTLSFTFSSGLGAGDKVMSDVFNFVTSGSGFHSVSNQVSVATVSQTLTNVPTFSFSAPNLLMVWVNGIKQIPNISYTVINTSSISFTSPLNVGDVIHAQVINLIGPGIELNYQHDVISVSGQTSITIDTPYAPGTELPIVFVNGVLQGLSSYVEVNGTSILLSSGLAVGDHVEVYVFNLIP